MVSLIRISLCLDVSKLALSILLIFYFSETLVANRNKLIFLAIVVSVVYILMF